MAEFVYLFVGGNIPEDLREQSMKEWGEWFENLGKTGKLRGGAPFGAPDKVMSAGGGVHDFDWGKDSGVSGYTVVEAETIEEAMKLAEDCPHLDKRYGDGTLEVRQAVAM